MTPPYDPPDEEQDWELDPDGPQECDLVDPLDDDAPPTVPCPSCCRDIPDFVDRCPYCHDWILQSAGPRHRPPWLFLAAVLALATLLTWLLMH